MIFLLDYTFTLCQWNQKKRIRVNRLPIHRRFAGSPDANIRHIIHRSLCSVVPDIEDNTMKLFGKKAQPKKEEPKTQEAVLTLYPCRKDGKAVPDIACRLFAEVMDKIFYTDEDAVQ